MDKKSFGLWFAVLSLVLVLAEGKAQAGAGIINVVEKELPAAYVIATGKGYPPRKDLSPAQKRLLAQRAATIDAYRSLSSTIRGVSGYIVNGTGCITTSGFVRGAELSSVRYFPNGKVEVDLTLPVNISGNRTIAKIDWDSVVANISRRGYPVCYTERPVQQISEEEWIQMRSK